MSTRAASWWFGPVPARRIDVCRALTFGYAAIWLTVRAWYVWDVSGLPSRRFAPVGVMTWLDAPPSRPVVMGAWAIGLACSVLAALGRGLRITAPLGSLTVLGIVTLTSSFGQVFHTEHLLALHLLILAAASIIEPARNATERSGWPLNLMMATLAATYVVAGIAKLRFSGTDWVTGDVLRNWVAADNLRKVLLDDPSSTFGGWLAGVGWVWGPIAVFTLLVELGAPLAMVSRRIRTPWLVAAWLFHVGIFAMMAISFPYQLSGVAYLAFVPAERLEARVRQAVAGGGPRRARMEVTERP
ncbi:MAG: HTTM domain-containing protein [Actinobacteria bacterium]|nr:HTTM domain-containing protein [Actinomycetota bacterium]